MTIHIGSSLEKRGRDGNTTIPMARAPLVSDGRLGDFFVNTVTFQGYGPKTAAGWGSPSILGINGWVAVISYVTDGARRVAKIVDWIGGAGTKPAINVYIPATGTAYTAIIADAADVRGAEGPEMLIEALADPAAELGDESFFGSAEDAGDNEKRRIIEIASVGGFLERRSRAHAIASSIPFQVRRLRLQHYAPSYAVPATLRGGGEFQRMAKADIDAAGYPSQSWFRSTDRHLPDSADDEDVDSVEGGYWVLAENEPTDCMLGAVKDFVFGTGAGTDNQPFLQALFTHNKARGGGRVRVEKGSAKYGSRSFIYDNTTLIIEDGAKIYRDWATTNSDWSLAVIVNEHMPDHGDYISAVTNYTQAERNENIHIVGPGGFDISAAARADAYDNSKFGGPYIALHFCDNVSIEGVDFVQAARQVCVSLYCNKYQVLNNRFSEGEEVFEVNVWVAAGTDGVISGNVFDSGDDNIGVGSNYDLPLDGLYIGTNVYRSKQGHAAQIVQNRLGSTAAFPAPVQKVKNITMVGGGGHLGELRNACIRTDTTLAPVDAIENITIIGWVIDHSGNVAHDDNNPYGVYLNGGKHIYIQARVVSPERAAVRIIGGTDEVTLDIDADAASDAAFYTVDIDTAGIVKLKGRIRGGLHGPILADDVALLLLDNLHVTGVPTGHAAVRLTGTTKCVSRGLSASKAVAATGTYGFALAATGVSLMHEGSELSGVDADVNFSAVPAAYVNKAPLTPTRIITIGASGNLSVGGSTDIKLLGEGGVSDTLNALSGGHEGMEINIQSGEADPAAVVITASHATSTGRLDFTQHGAANYLLDTAAKGLKARMQGGVWRVFALYG